MQKKKRRFILTMLSSLLILFLTSCATKNETTKTIYIYPQIYIPEPPKMKAESMIFYDYNGKQIKDLSQVKTSEIQNVLIPYWYLQLIADTFLDVETARIEYQSFINHLN